MYKLALLFAILATAQAQFISDGECVFPENGGTKSIELPTNGIEVISFYEIERINNTWNIGHCTSFNLTVSTVSGTLGVSVQMTEVLDHKLIERNATVTADEKFQIFEVVFSDFTSNFTVIGGGEEFTVLYACSNVGDQKKEYAWVLGVSTNLTETDKKATQAIIELHKLNNATWIETSHTEDSCRSGTNYIKLSPIIVLIVGFLITKGL